MSSTIIFGGRRRFTVSIQSPGRSASAARFSGRASHSASKRPIWLAEAAHPVIARSPTTHRIAKLDQQTAVEIEPQRLGFRFTRRVRHPPPRLTRFNVLTLISESGTKRSTTPFHPGNAGQYAFPIVQDLYRRLRAAGQLCC